MLSILPMALALEMTDAIIVVRRGGTDKSLYAMLLSVARSLRSTLLLLLFQALPRKRFSWTFPGLFQLDFSCAFPVCSVRPGEPRGRGSEVVSGRATELILIRRLMLVRALEAFRNSQPCSFVGRFQFVAPMRWGP